ncbi:MAG: TetR/AcrR family transcriptional regulator [Mycobacterium sp.]
MSELRRGVLAAAADLFAHDGFDGATMAGIAGVSGRSLKVLYAAFPGKQKLFEAVMPDRYKSHVFPVPLSDRTVSERSGCSALTFDPVQEGAEYDIGRRRLVSRHHL